MQEGRSLAGRSVLVTGGARRLGREIALTLARAGADVTISYRTACEEAAATVRAIQATGRRAQAVPCDVRDEDRVKAAVAAAADFSGRLDVVVNNAAIFESVKLEEISLEQWDAVFATNTRGPFLVARAALPYLRATRGHIVNLGSLGGIRAWAGHGHYCASKAAIHMLTQVMAKSFAPAVSVNCVAPGWIEMEDVGSERAERMAKKTPMGRNGTATEVAQAVLFFATSPHYVTGQVLAVDGGLGL
jgi:NAD(P)-dependent dehydrogenase (short-subunit alcohol dehydrogenase family)